MKQILVLNGISYAKAIDGLGPHTYNDSEFFNNPDDFSLVLFTGGSDVSPFLYGESSPAGLCYTNPERDKHEEAVFKLALKHNIPMAGICRGIQFLNVMAGGRLMHHIDSHGGGEHGMLIRAGRRDIVVNSLHHQMVIPHEDAEIVGVSSKRLSGRYISTVDMPIEYNGQEVEAAIFPKIKAFGVQYHPEMMPRSSYGYIYFYNMVKYALSLDWDKFITAYIEGLDDVPLLEIHESNSSTGG